MWKDGSGSYGCSGYVSDLEGLKRNDTNLQIQILAGRRCVKIGICQVKLGNR